MPTAFASRPSVSAALRKPLIPVSIRSTEDLTPFLYAAAGTTPFKDGAWEPSTRAKRRFVPPISMPMVADFMIAIPSNPAFERFGKPIVKFQKSFRYDTHVTCDSHEVGISIPAGNDVDMQMILYACAGCLAKIYAYVETVWVGNVPYQVAGPT